jgi:hypothetical protein
MVSKDSKGVLDIEMGFFSNIVGSLFFWAGGPGGLGHEGQTEIYDFYFRFAKNHQMVQCTGVAIFLEGLNFTFSKISNGERTQMYGENHLLGRLGALYSSGGTLFFFLQNSSILRSAKSPLVIVFRESCLPGGFGWIWNDDWIHLLPR